MTRRWTFESVDEQSAQLPGSAQAEFWDDLATEVFAMYRALTLEYLSNYSDPTFQSSPSEWVSAHSYRMGMIGPLHGLLLANRLLGSCSPRLCGGWPKPLQGSQTGLSRMGACGLWRRCTSGLSVVARTCGDQGAAR